MPTKGSTFDVPIVGMGHGGTQTAIALSQRGFDGLIAMIGDEPELPYERPPLSKDYLAGEVGIEKILIRPARFWTDREVSVVNGRRVVSLDHAAKAVTTHGGGPLLLPPARIAAGGRRRALTCGENDLSGVHTIRTQSDVDRMRDERPTISRAVVIGGGFIGLEAAAVLAKMEKSVSLGRQERDLARVSGKPLWQLIEAEHRVRGVDLRLSTVVECIEGFGSRVTGVGLASREVLPAEMVVVGIGIAPQVKPLLDAGAAGTAGIAVDGESRTTLDDVFARGDCAIQPNIHAPAEPMRLESVENANDHAGKVAWESLGRQRHRPVPWFWSNQFDIRLQTIGLIEGYDQTVTRGDPSSRSFSVVYLRERRVIALDCVNATKDYVQG